MIPDVATDTRGSRFASLSTVAPEWKAVEDIQNQKDKLSKGLFNLPISDFRAIPYVPPPLPEDTPVLGKDVLIYQDQVTLNDQRKIGIRVYRRPNPLPKSILFFNSHGGGWVMGSPETEEAQNRMIAVRNKAVVVSVDYRLAPEFPYPSAINDCFEILLWCKANADSLGVDPNKIVVGGGSAGANISAVMALKARDEGIEGIIGQVLNIPVTCHPNHFPVSRYEYFSYSQNSDAPIVDAAKMRWFWDKYLPSAKEEPYTSPLLASTLENLPPALIQVAGSDPLRDEGIAYAERLEECGVSVTLKLYPGLPHAFYIHPQLQSSIDYLNTVVEWINQNFEDDAGAGIP